VKQCPSPQGQNGVKTLLLGSLKMDMGAFWSSSNRRIRLSDIIQLRCNHEEGWGMLKTNFVDVWSRPQERCVSFQACAEELLRHQNKLWEAESSC
jgi:hypothetical protein